MGIPTYLRSGFSKNPAFGPISRGLYYGLVIESDFRIWLFLNNELLHPLIIY